jgi:MFS family permease
MAVALWHNLSRETDRVSGPELRRYMRLVTIAGALCMAYLGLSGGTALAELAKSLGASEGFYGWLNAAPYAAMAMQLPVSWLVERTRRRKWVFIWCVSIHRALFIPLALIPFVLPEDWRTVRLGALLGVYLSSQVLAAAGVPTWWGWMADMVPPRIRGRYWAARQQVLLLVNMPCALFAGWFLDKAIGTSLGRQGGIAILFTAAAVCGVVDILLFMFIPEIPKQPSTAEPTLGHLVLTPLKDVAFRRYMYYSVLISFATGGLMGQYSQRMMLDVVGMNNFRSNLCSTIMPAVGAWLAVRWWGRARDRWGSRPLVVIGTMLVVPHAAAWVFATPSAQWVGMLITFLGGATWVGIDIACTNLVLRFNEGRRVSSYQAINAMMTALGGVAGSALAGLIAGGLADRRWMMGPFPITNYHVLFILSSVLRIGAVVLAVRMIEPQAKPARQVIRLMWDSLYDGTRSLVFGGLRTFGWPERATNGNSRLRKT